jgi:hypothetical protein
MRGTVEQTWTPASLLLIASLAVGAATSAKPHLAAADPARGLEAVTPFAQCTAPAAMPLERRLEIGRRIAPRQAAAVLAVLTAPRARFVIH